MPCIPCYSPGLERHLLALVRSLQWPYNFSVHSAGLTCTRSLFTLYFPLALLSFVPSFTSHPFPPSPFPLSLVPSFTPSCPLLEELKEKHPDWPWSTLLPHTPLSNTDYAFIAIESGRCALVSSVYHTISLPTLLSTSSYTLSFYLLSICHIVSLVSIKQSFICFPAITLSHLWTAHHCLLFLILHRHSLPSSLPLSPCL
jgi:hypothetical protein